MFQDVFISCGNILYVYGRLVSQNDLSSRFFTRGSCTIRKINCLVWSLDLLAYSKLRWLFSLGRLFTDLERFKNRNSRVIEYVVNTFTSNRMCQLCRKCCNFEENKRYNWIELLRTSRCIKRVLKAWVAKRYRCWKPVIVPCLLYLSRRAETHACLNSSVYRLFATDGTRKGSFERKRGAFVIRCWCSTLRNHR